MSPREHHFGENVLVTRKGAVRAARGDMGSFLARWARGFHRAGFGQQGGVRSCSHGAGRAMSRSEAKRRFSLADHADMAAGVDCRKDADVIDETPRAYKPIEAVMAAQATRWRSFIPSPGRVREGLSGIKR